MFCSSILMLVLALAIVVVILQPVTLQERLEHHGATASGWT